MYEIVYCVASLVGLYALRQFMSMLYGKSCRKKYVELLSFGIYYIVSTVIYLTVDIPMMNMVLNLISFFLLSFNFHSDLKKRLFVTAFLYVVIMLIETFIWVLTSSIHIQVEISNQVRYSSLIGIILNQLSLLVVVTLCTNIKEMKQGNDIPLMYWACLIIIPFFSIYFIVILIQTGNALSFQMVISILALFMINISISILYNFIVKSMSEKAEKMLLEEQNKSYLEQYKVMQSSLMVTKSLRHDLKNHFIALKHMMKANEVSLAVEYINDILKEKLEAKAVQSGNVVVDSILGVKLQNAESEEIKCTLNFKIPENMEVTAEDMVVLLGNLFDNAIEAAKKLPVQERWITIHMQYDRNCLYINASNSFNGEKDMHWRTIKSDKENHGIGLLNIKKIVEKYNGNFEIRDDEEKVFKISILLYPESGMTKER